MNAPHTRAAASSLLLVLLCASLAACGGADTETDAPRQDNEAPVAVITSPSAIRAGTPALFDASDSTDEDGEIVGYIFDFGDGGPFFEGVSPESFHTYAAPGQFSVTLTVLDDEGRKDSVTANVTVRE